MTLNQYIVIYYIIFWAVRINGCLRRGRQPLFRGPEWFFSVHVRPDFYTGEGRNILRRYWMRMLIPFAVDIPLAIAIFISGHLQLLNLLILAVAALIHINHSFSVPLAERQAQPFAVLEDEQPVSSVVFSLKPRRLRDYSNRTLEIAMALSSVVAFVWLAHYYLTSPGHQNLRQVFGPPVLWLYIQSGFLFAKFVIVAWRSPAPQTQADKHLEAREERRKFYLRMCDWSRILHSILILSWPVLLTASPTYRERLGTIWLMGLLVTGVALTVWGEIRRKQVLKVALLARPVKLPDLMGHAETLKWPVCYQPSAPLSVLKGAHGYSLNFANALTQLGTAYLAGMAVLVTVLFMRR